MKESKNEEILLSSNKKKYLEDNSRMRLEFDQLKS
jgi:hypothetical protein